jgi:predicted transcriptional regulator
MMTTEDLLEALQAAKQTDDGEGSTVSELCEAMGRADEHVRKQLKKMIAAGQIRVSRKVINAMDGSRRPVASYVLVKR